MQEQYQALLEQAFSGKAEGIGIRLCEFLQAWEGELFTGAAVPLYDKAQLRGDDNEAASFLISLPGALHSGAILCGSNGAQEEANRLMRLSERLAESLEKACLAAHIERKSIENIARMLVGFDLAAHRRLKKARRPQPV